MSKSETKPYSVMYADGTYLVFELTQEDYDTLKQAVVDVKVADISIGLLVTSDIRSIIIQKPKIEQHKGSNPDLPAGSKEWLEQVEKADDYLKDEEVIEDDYAPGGMIV